MDFALDSVNHGEGAGIRSPIKSRQELQQEYMPVINIDEDSDSDDAMASALADPAAEPLPVAASSTDDAQHAEIVQELVNVVADLAALDTTLSTTLDTAVVSGELDTAMAAVATMLGSDEQMSKPIMQGVGEEPKQRASTMPAMALEEEQTSQPIVEDAMPATALDEQTSQPIVQGAMLAMASDEQAFQPIGKDVAHESEQRHTTVPFSTSNEQSSQSITEVVQRETVLPSDEQASQSSAQVDATVCTFEQMPEPVIENGGGDRAEVDINVSILTSDAHVSEPIPDAGDTVQTDPVLESDKQESQPSMEQEAGDTEQTDPTLESDKRTSQPSMENQADDTVQMEVSNLALDAQISYPMLEAVGSPVDSPTFALTTDEQVSLPILLDVAEAPVHSGTTMLVEEAEGQALLPITEQAAQANSDSQEHSRWWFSCVSCSRRSRPVTKRKMEDESKEMCEPDAKRYMRWTKARR